MKKFLYIFIFAITLLMVSACGRDKGNTKYQSFTEVKDILLTHVYDAHRFTFYCNCRFTPKKQVRCKIGTGKRATRVEWEHIVPASRFGKTFDAWESQKSLSCWLPKFIRNIFSIKCRTISSRKNARRKSEQYRLMESDMYNLVPAIGSVNQQRRNYDYGIIPGEERKFGRCDFEVSGKIVEPAPHIRGDIARIYFYMNDAYPGRNIMSDKDARMFQAWDRNDPVDQQECERCREIEQLQENINPFVKIPCQEKGWW